MTAVCVGYLTEALSEIRWSRAAETAVRQDTKTEPYPLRHLQPVNVTEERGDVFRTSHRVHELSGSTEDCLESVEKMTRDASQH